MTIKVKAKPISQIRREQKAAKMAKKIKVIEKHKANQLAEAKMKSDLKDHREKFDAGLKELYIRRDAKIADENMTDEDYFVREIGTLDQTLTDIGAGIHTMSAIRHSLGWEQRKEFFQEANVKVIDEKITELETSNTAFYERFKESVMTSMEGLEKLKLAVTREAIDVYTLGASTDAFGIFAEWNEVVVDKFHEVHDLVENLTTGETK